MANVSIKRVGYDRTIFEKLKQLAPVGENVNLISEGKHLERLKNIPPLAESLDLDRIIKKIELMKRKDSRYLFEILEPKPDSSRITIVFPDEDDISTSIVWNLRKSMEPGYELYIGSPNFNFGIFVTFKEIEIWDASHE
ncbi:MAG: hypothetical protein AAF585_24495 [Verrucomicrobiota bacterium]